MYIKISKKCVGSYGFLLCFFFLGVGSFLFPDEGAARTQSRSSRGELAELLEESDVKQSHLTQEESPSLKEGVLQCECICRSEMLAVRHTEGGGVGYSMGYTTVQGFFMTEIQTKKKLFPVIDLRGHVFNNGKYAANVGMGVRYMGDWVWGANAYYDYRGTRHHNYNQAGLGLECLGAYVDLRGNVYLPTVSSHHCGRERHFENRDGELFAVRKKKLALNGGNLECGGILKKSKNSELYLAAGPYYFGRDDKHAYGGEARMNLKLYDFLYLQVIGSYDTLFNGIVQGQVALFIPFKHVKKVNNKESSSCGSLCTLYDAMTRPVYRSEIIVLDTKKKKSKL